MFCLSIKTFDSMWSWSYLIIPKCFNSINYNIGNFNCKTVNEPMSLTFSVKFPLDHRNKVYHIALRNADEVYFTKHSQYTVFLLPSR